VTKVGDSRVGLVGFPSVGKSTLLNKLTGTFSEVASYEFTTLTCIPGVIRYRGAKIQLLDLPGIIEGAKDGKGRGRQVISTARTCSLILIVLDALKPITHKRLIEHELEGFGIRLNKEPPKITFKRKERGGVSFASTVQTTHLDLETVTQILKEYRISSADVRMQGDYTDEDLIDVIEGNRIYIPCIYVCNKIDQITLEELELLDRMPHYCPVSAHQMWNMDGLLEMIWEYLDLVRIYTKPKGLNPDYNEPVILPRRSSTVEDFCNRIHKLLIKQFKYALVWGISAKHRPQRVGREHQLDDEDVVRCVRCWQHAHGAARAADARLRRRCKSSRSEACRCACCAVLRPVVTCAHGTTTIDDLSAAGGAAPVMRSDCRFTACCQRMCTTCLRRNPCPKTRRARPAALLTRVADVITAVRGDFAPLHALSRLPNLQKNGCLCDRRAGGRLLRHVPLQRRGGRCARRRVRLQGVLPGRRFRCADGQRRRGALQGARGARGRSG
jgi:small GTP-binding protein